MLYCKLQEWYKPTSPRVQSHGREMHTYECVYLHQCRIYQLCLLLWTRTRNFCCAFIAGKQDITPLPYDWVLVEVDEHVYMKSNENFTLSQDSNFATPALWTLTIGKREPESGQPGRCTQVLGTWPLRNDFVTSYLFQRLDSIIYVGDG